MTEIHGEVYDVKDGSYLVKAEDGVEYRIQVGSIEIIEGAVIKVDENTHLVLHLPEQMEELLDNDLLDEDFGQRQEENTDPERAEWPEQPTRLLIDLYESKKKLVIERKIKTMKKMWLAIQAEINKYGYTYTSIQVESKWKSLERAFKKKMAASKKTGRGRMFCPYERELSEILLKKKSVLPPLVLDSEIEKSDRQILAESGLHCVNVQPSTSFGVQESTPFTYKEADILNSRTSSVAQQNLLDVEGQNTSAETPRRQLNITESGILSGTQSRQKRRNVRTEVQKLREVMEERCQKQIEIEQKNYEQRERILNETIRRNNLLQELIERL